LWFGEKPKGQELADSTHETAHDDNDGNETKDVLIAKAMLKLLGAKLMPVGKKGQRGEQVQVYELVRDYKSVYEDGERVYFGIVPWGGDNRYQVFDLWLKRDTEYQEKQNVSGDTVSTFLYKDINKSEYQEVTTEKGDMAIAPGPIAQQTRQAENIPTAIAPNSKPNTPPKNVDASELRLRAYQRGWDGSPFSLMQYA